MNKFKVFILTILTTILFTVSVYAKEDISIYINNTKQNFSSSPFIIDNYTYVPMRDIFTTLGYNIGWNDQTKTVTGLAEGVSISVTINSRVAVVNDKKVTLDSPAVIKNSVTYIPLRFIAESTGYSVSWDGTTKSVFISNEPKVSATPTLEDSVVMILTNKAQGSGVVISSDGLIVSNYHVLRNSDSINVHFNDQSVSKDNIQIKYIDKARDLAIIKVDKKNLVAAKIGDSDTIELGDPVITIGSPESVFNVRTTGIVKDINTNYFCATSPIKMGSSGGGIFNDKNELIGISHSYNLEGNYHFIKINHLKLSNLSNSYTYADLTLNGPTTPVGLTAKYKDDYVFFDWAQSFGADFYKLYVSDTPDGQYKDLKVSLNAQTMQNQWSWNFPFSLAIPAKTIKSPHYYKIAASRNGVISELSPYVEVLPQKNEQLKNS